MNCGECKWGVITMHSSHDRCTHANNSQGMHPYALRHDANQCGEGGAWFQSRPAPEAAYKAAPPE